MLQVEHHVLCWAYGQNGDYDSGEIENNSPRGKAFKVFGGVEEVKVGETRMQPRSPSSSIKGESIGTYNPPRATCHLTTRVYILA